VFQLQQLEPNWSDATELPESQRLWLDRGKFDLREHSEDWQTQVAEAMARWSIVAYRRYMKDNAVALGEVEEKRFTAEALHYGKSIVEDLT
jgi:hypothetical protein